MDLGPVSGIVDGLAKLDPLNDLIDLGASMLGLPSEVTSAVKMGVGALTGDPVLLVDGSVGLAEGLPAQTGPQTEYATSGGSGASPDPGCPGYAAGPPSYDPDPQAIGQGGWPPGDPAALPGAFGSPLDPNILGYRDCLRTLQANFETFQAMGGGGGTLNKGDLRAILGDPAASPELKQAAGFLLEHPEYFKRLAKGLDFQDAARIGPSDIQAELAQVDQALATYGAPTAPGAPPPDGTPASGGPPPGGTGGGIASGDGGGGGSDSIRQLLSNPNLSIEEKIEEVLAYISQSTDGEAQNLMQQMAAVQDQRAGTKDQAQARALDQSYEQLQLRLQQCMQRRQQMFDLQSNISAKFDQMAMVAIQNLGRG